MESSPIIFDDITPTEVPVQVGTNRYVLREASEAAACKYRNAGMRGAKRTGERTFSLPDNLADTEPLLVSLCLYETGEDWKLRYLPDGVTPDPKYLVKLATVLAWPARVVKYLHAKAKEISHLDEVKSRESLVEEMERLRRQLDRLPAEESAKNGRSATTATSA